MNGSTNKWIGLAGYNVRWEPRFFLRMVQGLTLMVCILTLTFLINAGITNVYNDILYNSANLKGVFIEAGVEADGTFTDESEVVYRHLLTMDHVYKPCIRRAMDVPTCTGNADYAIINMDRVSLWMEGTEYAGSNDNANDFMEGRKKDVLNVDFYLTEGVVFTKNDRDQFHYCFPKERLVLEGEEMSRSGEVMLSDYMLDRFGIDNYADVVGKRIYFTVDGKPFMKDVRVAGVINSNYCRIGAHGNYSHILYYGDRGDLATYGMESLYIHAPVDSYENLVAVEKELEELEELGHDYFDMWGELIASQYHYIVRMQAVANYVLVYVIAFILVAMMLNLYSMLSSHMASKKQYYGMMRAMGIRRSGIHTILAAELLAILLTATLLSAGVAAALSYGINRYVSLIIGSGVEITFHQYSKTLLLSSGAVGAFVLLLSCILLARMQDGEISDQLRVK